MSQASLQKKMGLLSGIAVLSMGLVACSVPHGMPTGYTYHGDLYKSKTPDPSPRVTSAQRALMGVEQAEQFRRATYDILTRLTSRAGVPPKPVYIAAADPMTPFYANIDNDLREAMRAQGYRLADTADGAYIIQYHADLLPGYRSYDLEKAAMGTPNIQLTMDVMTDIHGTLKPLTQEVGEYYIKGAEELLIPMPHHKYQPVETETRFMDEAGTNAPRTSNVYHGDNQLHTIQPIMDKTDAPQVNIIESPKVSPDISYAQPPEPVTSLQIPADQPLEYVVSAPEEQGDAPAIEIFDPETSQPLGTYDYSASMNDMSQSAAPLIRRGPRVSKQVEY